MLTNECFDTADSIGGGGGVPRGPTDQTTKRENTYSGEFNKIVSGNKVIFLNLIEHLSAMPEFAHLGPIFKSSSPVDLTESEVEYVVRCIKHVFSHYVVFQVNQSFSSFGFVLINSSFSLI